MDFNISIDLCKLRGAMAKNMTFESGTKPCLIVPIEDAHLQLRQTTKDGKVVNHIYLNLSAWETQSSKYGDSHYVKVEVPKAIREALPKEELNAHAPIVGNMKPFQPKLDAEAVNASAATSDIPPQTESGDAPF